MSSRLFEVYINFILEKEKEGNGKGLHYLLRDIIQNLNNIE
jgi:hypothetical protein